MEKTSVYEQVWALKKELNIPHNVTEKIISGYKSFCVEKLLNNEIVDIRGIAKILPKNAKCEFSTTLAYDCIEIAKRIGSSVMTVYYVIDSYLTSLEDDLFEGKVVEIRGLLTVSPVKENGKYATVYSLMSGSLRQKLRDAGIQGTRVHTSKLLKYNLGKAGII